MDFIISFSVLSLTAFIYYDATKHGIGKVEGESGMFNLSAGAWAICSLFLAIIAVPAYFIKRKSLIEKARVKPILVSGRTAKLSILIALPTLFLLASLTQSPQVSNSSTSENGLDHIDFADFLVDFNQYQNKQVVVTGILVPQDDSSAFFYEDIGSSNTLFLTTERLPNEDKKDILRECGSGCEASLILTPAIILGSKGAIVLGINR